MFGSRRSRISDELFRFQFNLAGTPRPTLSSLPSRAIFAQQRLRSKTKQGPILGRYLSAMLTCPFSPVTVR